jgi:hypothetical protein
MFRLRDLVGLAVIVAILVVPDETEPVWMRLALAGVGILIVLEVGWELLRARRK